MAAAKESLISRQGTGMGCCQHQMLHTVDQRHLCPGIGSTKKEHKRLFPLVQMADDAVGKLLPPFVFVGVGLGLPDGEHGVEHQYTLVGPLQKIAVAGDGAAQIGLQLLVHILQRGRDLHAPLHRKSKRCRGGVG